MTLQAVFLDSSPLDLLTRRSGILEADTCRTWVQTLRQNGVTLFLPEIADYEARRGLLAAGHAARIARLDTLKTKLTYLPVSTAAWLKAAELWANASRAGFSTADKHALDGDVILAAQALTSGFAPGTFLVATDNPRHLSRYVSADEWRNISP